MTVTQTVAAVITIGSLAGGIIAIEERYAHSAEVKELRLELRQKVLEDRLDRVQERIWKMEERRRQTPADLEDRRRLEADKARIENQLKIIEQQAVK